MWFKIAGVWDRTIPDGNFKHGGAKWGHPPILVLSVIVATNLLASLYSTYDAPAYSRARRIYSPRPGMPGHCYRIQSLHIRPQCHTIAHVIEDIIFFLLLFQSRLRDSVVAHDDRREGERSQQSRCTTRRVASQKLMLFSQLNSHLPQYNSWLAIEMSQP
jgi:hypothetical protein